MGSISWYSVDFDAHYPQILQVVLARLLGIQSWKVHYTGQHLESVSVPALQLVFGYGTLGVVVLVMWTFFFAWEKTFQDHPKP